MDQPDSIPFADCINDYPLTVKSLQLGAEGDGASELNRVSLVPQFNDGSGDAPGI